MTQKESPFGKAATHPLMALVFSLMFQGLSNIQNFNIPYITDFALEAAILMMISQIAIGVAYALQSDLDGFLYIGGTILGVYLIANSSFKMDIFGWIGAIGAIIFAVVILLKRNRII